MIPLSDDNSTLQDTHYVGHDGVYCAYLNVTKFSGAQNSQFYHFWFYRYVCCKMHDRFLISIDKLQNH